MPDAGNTSHGAQRTATSLQMLQRIHGAAMRNHTLHGDPKWQCITRELEARTPAFSGNGLSMCELVEAWPGGEHAILLEAVDQFNKRLRVKRVLPPKTIGA